MSHSFTAVVYSRASAEFILQGALEVSGLASSMSRSVVVEVLEGWCEFPTRDYLISFPRLFVCAHHPLGLHHGPLLHAFVPSLVLLAFVPFGVKSDALLIMLFGHASLLIM